MENAQLVSLSRQIALQRQMDVVANNMANITTTGFKAEQLLYEQFDMPVAREKEFAYPDQPLAFVQDWATVHDLAPGAIVQTGNPFDVALNGDGFFAVETPQGERWTRSGAFQLDPNGTLVDLSGNPVMGDGGPITFSPDETDFSITGDGSIVTSAGAKGRLRIVEFEAPQALAREGNNLFSGGTPLPATRTTAQQGAIEKSNVSGVSEMTEMIRVTRAYESLASLMQRQDDIRRSAVQRLGDANA